METREVLLVLFFPLLLAFAFRLDTCVNTEMRLHRDKAEFAALGRYLIASNGVLNENTVGFPLVVVTILSAWVARNPNGKRTIENLYAVLNPICEIGEK